MFTYFAYCLRISSEIELPSLPPAAAGGEVVVRRVGCDSQAGPPPKMSTAFHITPRFATLDYAGLGTLTVRDGREIVFTPLPVADEAPLPQLIAGTALPVLLYQRGLLVLQASAVAIHGTAALFVAGDGGGKSTLAACLLKRGHQLLADDNAAVDIHDGHPLVLPAGPMAPLSRGHGDPQRPWPGAGCVATGPAPLRAIYLLRTRYENNISYLPLQVGLAAVSHHSYPSCLMQPGGLDHLRLCSRLVGAVPVCELARSDTLADLAEVADMVEAHMDVLAPPAGRPRP